MSRRGVQLELELVAGGAVEAFLFPFQTIRNVVQVGRRNGIIVSEFQQQQQPAVCICFDCSTRVSNPAAAVHVLREQQKNF